MVDGTQTPDVCVIGGGPAGMAVAAGAAALGVSTMLVARTLPAASAESAAIASSFAAAAAFIHAVRHADRLGLRAGAPEIDYAALRRHVEKLTRDLGRNRSAARLAALGVQTVAADGQFIDAKTLKAGDLRIRARRFVIATGAAPVVPEIPGLAGVSFLDAGTVFDLADRPRHLAVIGAGATGLSLAQIFRRLGSEVTVFDAAAPLAGEDPECAAILLDALAAEGIAVSDEVRIERVEKSGDAIRMTISRNGAAQAVSASHLLVACGRRPDIDGLGLAAAGIELESGRLRLTRGLRTANRRVFAAGAAGGADSLHAARSHARLVLRQILFGLPAPLSPAPVPRVVPTDPPLAHVGLREDEARARHGRIGVLRWPFRENDRAEIEGRGHGIVKLVTARRGRIVGATIVGMHADELVASYALAIARRANARDLAELSVPYPTLAEIGRDAALAGAARHLTGRWARRIIAWMRLLP